MIKLAFLLSQRCAYLYILRKERPHVCTKTKRVVYFKGHLYFWSHQIQVMTDTTNKKVVYKVY